MTKKITLAIFLIVLCFIGTKSFNSANSNGNGAPAAKTGSPGDGASCTGCHSGTATSQTGWITSDIPSGGYTAGSTYTITATATASGINEFGFEISPQNTSGTLMGSMTVTNATETKLISNKKYITHTSSGTSGTNNSKSWSFSWTAPATGSGDVTFYGAFNAANGDNDDSGDKIYTSILTVSEAITTDIKETSTENNSVSIFPNPIYSSFSVSYTTEEISKIRIELIDISGKVISKLLETNRSKGSFTENFELEAGLPSGIYFIKTSIGNSSSLQKVMIR